jgi:hypothetical protein
VDQENVLFHGRARQEYVCSGQPMLIWDVRCLRHGTASCTAIDGRGCMVSKQATAAFSVGRREHMFGLDSFHGPLVDGFLRAFFQGTLGYVGFEVIAPFVAYHVPYLALEQRQALLDKLETHIAIRTHTQDRHPGSSEFQRSVRTALTLWGTTFNAITGSKTLDILL